MDLFNSIIQKTEALIGASVSVKFDYAPSSSWKETKEFELIMTRDAAYELGGSGKPSVNYSCVTTDSALVPKDEIIVCGPELRDLGSDSPYARIALIRVDSIPSSSDSDKPSYSDAAFRAVQKIDFVKYHVFPEGYMIRTSSESNREQVRISGKAVRDGISFSKIGSTFISHYKKADHVEAVRMIFITDPGFDYASLSAYAGQVHDITMTLSKILEGMPTDCHTCKLKPICDEVEGLKELHFGSGKKE